MTVDYITKLRPFFSDSAPLDVAMFACLTAAFWSTARLREFTTKNLSAFDPEAHVKRSNLGESEDRNGLKTTTIFVPRMKSSPIKGESLYWGKQLGASDPVSRSDFRDYSILELCGLCSLHSQAPLVSRCPLASRCPLVS